VRQIKGAPGLELLPSQKDPRKLRWQRIAPKQKASRQTKQVATEDEETRRYHKLREILRKATEQGKRLRRHLRKMKVSENDAQRITSDYLFKKIASFLNEDAPEFPLPDYPVYPKELQRKPSNPKPPEPVNPGYEIWVMGGEGNEKAAAKEFVEHLLGVIREIHPLPKTQLEIKVAVPSHLKGIEDFGWWARFYNQDPSRVVGLHLKQYSGNYLIVLNGFRPLIHEFGHFIFDAFYQLGWKEPYLFEPGGSLHSAYMKLYGALRDWFQEHKQEILELTFRRYGLEGKNVREDELRQIREFYEGWLTKENEIFAYTYEQYVIWKLMELGRKDWAQFWLEAAVKSFTPLFPAEMFKPVKEAYDRFFDAVRRIVRDRDALKWLPQSVWIRF
jgi:hypothetical protein